MQGICAEYKDDSSIIPRSSSVIVKRVPARPGRGAARYLGAAGPAQGSSDPTGKSGVGGGVGWRAGGHMSKRFDGKELKEHKEEPKPAEKVPAPVCCLVGVCSTQPDRFTRFLKMRRQLWQPCFRLRRRTGRKPRRRCHSWCRAHAPFFVCVAYTDLMNFVSHHCLSEPFV